MSKEVEVLARGVHIEKGHLLVCRTRGSDMTYLPGGHVEFDESVPDSLAREIEEEMGRHAKVGAFLGVVEHSFMQKGELHCEINLIFRMKVEGLKAPQRPVSREGHIGFEWIPLDRLSRSDLEPSVVKGLLRKWATQRGAASGWGSTMKNKRLKAR
jgi:8-oxo-dGTP diphosphatase